MDKDEALAFADQISAAIRDIFIERGYDVDFTLAFDIGGAIMFSMKPNGIRLSLDVINNILSEAASRIGCNTYEC